MKLRLSLSLILILLTTLLFGGNSVFSFEGTPCQNYGYDTYGISMGNVGISDVFRKNTGYANPAILGTGNRTLFSTGMMFGWTGYKSKGTVERSYRDNSLDFPFFSVAIPVSNHHFGFQFNSMASGVVENQSTFDQIIFEGTTPVDTLSITEQQSIDRYLYRGDLVYAYHYHHLNFGASLNYYFGHDIRKFYQNAGFGIFNTSESITSTYKNPSATIGFTADRENLAGGMYYSFGCVLEGNRTRTSIHETEELGTIRHSVPSQLGTGLTYKLDNEFKLSADYIYSFWKDAKYADYGKNSWKAGFGFAHDPKEGDRTTFMGQMPKRIGISYRELPFSVNGNAVTETAVSTGITFPIQRSENQIDFGLQYTMRGNLDDNDRQDRALMFMVGITGFDILTKAFNRKAPREIPQVEEITQ